MNPTAAYLSVGMTTIVPPLPRSIPVYVDGKEYLASVRELAASRVRLTWFEMDGSKQSVVRERAAVEWAELRKMAVAV